MVTASDRHRGSGCPLTLATPPCVHGGSRCYASSHPPNSEARVSGNRSWEARRIRSWRGRGTRGCSPVLDVRPWVVFHCRQSATRSRVISRPHADAGRQREGLAVDRLHSTALNVIVAAIKHFWCQQVKSCRASPVQFHQPGVGRPPAPISTADDELH